MARTKKSETETVTIRVLTSFDGFRQGEQYTGAWDALLQGWVNAGLMEVIEGGKDPAGPSSAEPDVPGASED